MSRKSFNRIGEESYSKYGGKMKIINYRNAKDIDVLFEEYDCVVENAQYKQFKNNNLICPLYPTVCGVGYIGIGKYKSTHKAYKIWWGILSRAYDKHTKEKQPTYEEVIVDTTWFNFQNFAKWYEENYYEIENETMALDKDILCKGNKVYSPNTCVFVPQLINNIFTKRDRYRGELPIGITEHIDGRFKVRVNEYDKRIYFGLYNTIEEAFQVYKKEKERYIKEVADKYKPYIPNKLYEAMYNYEVEITD